MGNEREITIRVRADGTAEVVNNLDDVTNKTKDMGEKTVKFSGMARLGIWGLGEQVQVLGSQFGIPFQMTRRIGNAFEELAARSGMLAAGLGGIGIAVMAGVMIWQHFAEAQKKAREEIEKSIAALEGDVSALFKNAQETEGLQRAKYKLALVEKELLQIRLEEKYQLEYERLKELQDEIKNGPGFLAELGQSFRAMWQTFATNKDVVAQFEKNIAELRTKGTQEAKKLAAELEVIFERIKSLNRSASFADFKGDIKYGPSKEDLDSYLRWQQAVAAATIQNFNTESDYLKALDDLWAIADKNYEGRLDMQLEAFDRTTTAKLTALSVAGASEDAIREAWAVAEIERQARIAKARKDAEEPALAASRAGLAAYIAQITDLKAAQFQLMLQNDQMTTSLLNAGIGWDNLAKTTQGASLIMAANEELIRAAQESRGRVSQTVNQAMQNQLLRLVETHKFSVDAIAQALIQSVKLELLSVAAKAAVQALYFTAIGIAASSGPWGVATFGNPGQWFAAAAKMAMIAGVATAGAAAVNLVSGPGAQQPAPGTQGGLPIQTTSGPNQYMYYKYEQSKYGTGWRPGEEQPQPQPVVNYYIDKVQAWDSKDVKKFLMENASAVKDVNKEIAGGYV
jgi:hypothetical protein